MDDIHFLSIVLTSTFHFTCMITEYEKYVGDKLALGKKAQKKQEASRKAGVREMIEDAEEDDSELDELDRWEQEMIKFGGVRTKKVDDSESSEMNRNYRPAPSKYTVRKRNVIRASFSSISFFVQFLNKLPYPLYRMFSLVSPLCLVIWKNPSKTMTSS
jgi:Nineteen complex-related protein 2